MAKVSISEAARQLGISRQHMYRKFIKPGLVTVERDAEGNPVIDTAELLRVGNGRLGGGDVTPVSDSLGQGDTAELRAEVTLLRQRIAELLERDQEARRREEEAREREAWFRSQLDRLTLIEHKPKGFWARLFGGVGS